jgi:RNA polymerase sigma factor (sigma-70 family)
VVVGSASAERTDTGRLLTVLYKEHATEAFRYALHLTGHRPDAEDVVQHVFLQAHRHLDAGRELVSPRAWLLTAVKHRAYNLARDRREIALDHPELTAQVAEAACEEAVALAEVRGMLWTLPEAQHQAFVLRHWSGLSQNEIADVLDTTPSAVESLLARARVALLRSHDAASAACSGVRTRLLESPAPGAPDRQHIDSCRPCRHASTRLSRAANLASSLALVPGAHVADSLAQLVPGFSAHAATSTVAAGTTGAGAAGAGSSAGLSGATATWGTTAVSTAGKAAVTAKAVLAAVAATAVVGAVPAARHAVSDLVVRHSAAPAPHVARHHTRHAAPAAPPGAPPAQEPVAPAGDSEGPPAENPGKHAGAGKGDVNGNGKPADPGGGKPASPGEGKKPADPGGGNGNGSASGSGGNGKAVGKPTGTGGGKPTGKSGGKPAGTGGGGSGKATGAGTGDAGGSGNGGGKPEDVGGGKP